MGFLDPGKILVILVIALVVLGPERLPRAARQLGAAWRELTRVRDQVTDEMRSALPDIDLPNIPRMPTNMVSGFISDLTKPSVRDVGGDASGESAVHIEVDASADELYSASSSGMSSSGPSDAPDGTTPAWASESSASGDLAPAAASWPTASSPWSQDRRRAATERAHVEVPIASDDPSMN